MTVNDYLARRNGVCVVDEADSVLIDEARTPLIIFKQVPAPANKYKAAQTLAENLKEGAHYAVDLKNKNVVVGGRRCGRATRPSLYLQDPALDSSPDEAEFPQMNKCGILLLPVEGMCGCESTAGDAICLVIFNSSYKTAELYRLVNSTAMVLLYGQPNISL